MYLLHQPLDHRWSQERIAMGWNLTPPDEPWIMGPPKTMATADYATQAYFAENADVLIYANGVPYITQSMLVRRHKTGKLSLRIGERFFKEPLPWYSCLSPKKWIGRLIVHHRYESAGIHFLTMGHGCAKDLDYYWACKGRTWRWGYFTETSNECCVKPVRPKVVVGWCGRMIAWKHVDYIIQAVAALPPEIKAKMLVRLVGSGNQESYLKQLACEYGIESIVQFYDSMTSADALEFMRDIDIYMFPSNRMEGWGAALLEAMDKGCAVIANNEAGSTLEVVVDGVNGYTFNDGNISELSNKLATLVVDGGLRHRFGKKAWETMQGWSPQVAALKLLELIDGIKNKKVAKIPTSGICGFIR